MAFVCNPRAGEVKTSRILASSRSLISKPQIPIGGPVSDQWQTAAVGHLRLTSDLHVRDTDTLRGRERGEESYQGTGVPPSVQQ